ncbi:uncharacterized protein LOC133900228 [Phragmites australis]|uniref:uncharacterized protein LOC133900228 n=1 Tax=Phragmites australis TaxID=29695 RepID=UPI002D787484|nr:uncharacterized protein LOC133900228 [Phragmites australis]
MIPSPEIAWTVVFLYFFRYGFHFPPSNGEQGSCTIVEAYLDIRAVDDFTLSELHRRDLTSEGEEADGLFAVLSLEVADKKTRPLFNVIPSSNCSRVLVPSWRWIPMLEKDYVGIPGRRADDAFFITAVKETQKWGEGVPSPTGRDIDGKYLDENGNALKKIFDKWKLEWPEYGVTEIRAVVTDLGPENIVQIVTDNGSNYKKACQVLRREYPAIAWQPCVAHTINLMLKSVGDFREHDIVIQSARAISRWLYNHSKLHEMMKAAIGGELVRWNATRFGTNYLFLDSFLRRKDRFMQWMASSELQQSRYISSDIGRYAHSCLSSLPWWDNLKMVVDSVQPLYAFLRFADQDKVPTLSEVLLRYTIVKHEYESLYKNDRDSLDKYMAIVDRRMNDLANGTYMNAAAALNPRTHYAYGTGPTLFEDLREAFERLTDVTTAAEALIEAETMNLSLCLVGCMMEFAVADEWAQLHNAASSEPGSELQLIPAHERM